MRSTTKKLGPYIRQVDRRNSDDKVSYLRGISSVHKDFIKSKANMVGVSLKKYKVVNFKEFAFNPNTARMGDRIPIALNLGETCVVSSIYPVFEVINHEELLPEYLMMWFRRPEFDRYARFKSHGSAREVFSWEEMCEVELPIPTIEKQKEIVREYNIIVNRIQLNEELCQKLEETAQAIYKQWFIDFEFPISTEYASSIGKPNLKGKPYKSAGGEMIFCKNTGQEIPKSWEEVTLGEISDLSAGGDRPKIFSSNKTTEFSIPIFSNSTKNEGLYGYTNKAKITRNSITVSARGAIIGYTVMRRQPFVPIVRLIVATPKSENLFNFTFGAITRLRFDSGASAQGQLTVPDFSSFKILRPDDITLSIYQKLTSPIYHQKKEKEEQSKLLTHLLETLRARMTKPVASSDIAA